MWIEEDGTCIVLLPGPPRELEAMIEADVLPRVRCLGKGRRLAKKAIHVTGMTESEVDSLVAPIYKAYPRVQTTILASIGHIALRLYRWLEPGEEPEELEELASKIQEALGDAVFSNRGETLEQVVGRLLRESDRTLAVAESCTSGMIGARITRVPGSSDYFLGGVLCYSNDLKRSLCGVPEEMLRQHGAVSAEVAEALARGTRESLQSSVGLSVTGIAGPGGGSDEKPVGLVFVGLADEARTVHWRRIIPGDRETMRERATYFALSLLRRFLTPHGSREHA
jgi:nicotinamide-nucleotide amidase